MILNFQALITGNKVDALMDYIYENKVDISFLNKTWLMSVINNDNMHVVRVGGFIRFQTCIYIYAG